MSKVYPVDPHFAANALVRKDDYSRLYAESISDPEKFWGKVGQRLDWIKQPTKIRDVSFDPHDVHIRWYEDGTLNASVNCLDRHLEKRGNKVATATVPWPALPFTTVHAAPTTPPRREPATTNLTGCRTSIDSQRFKSICSGSSKKSVIGSGWMRTPLPISKATL